MTPISARLKYWLVIVGFCLVSACESYDLRPPSDRIISSDADRVTDDREIVVLVNSTSAAGNLINRARKNRYRLKKRERMEGLDLIMLVFEIPPGVNGAAAIAELERLEPSATAGVNHRYTLQGVNMNRAHFATHNAGGVDDRFYANDMMGWPDSGCPGHVAVGMIDAGVDSSDPELRNQNLVQKSFSGTPSYRRTSHGTAVAKLLIGSGRLSDTQLFSADVIDTDKNDSTGVDSFLSAVNWLSLQNVNLVNVSLAGPYNKILDRGLQRATSKGMIFVAAVGNDGQTAPPRYPAALPYVVAVTAIDQNFDIYRRAVRGDHVDFAAPGVDIAVTVNEERRYLSGTSIATPFVTTRIAADPVSATQTVDTVKKRLAASVMDLGSPGRDAVFGQGMILGSPDCLFR